MHKMLAADWIGLQLTRKQFKTCHISKNIYKYLSKNKQAFFSRVEGGNNNDYF